MLQRALLILALAIFIPSALLACTCSKEPPGKCPGLQSDDVVFLGTVTDISAVAATPPPAPSTTDPNAAADAAAANAEAAATAVAAQANGNTPIIRYHFHINERFAGPDSPDIDVFSGGDDGDCGYNFKPGDQYIVFTQQETEGRLFATICNGTRRAPAGPAPPPPPRAMRNHDRVASVFGLLHRADPPLLAPSDDPDDPLPNIKLKLRSKDDRFATSTGPDGVYSFYDVHAGEYEYTANLPARFEFTQKTLKGGLPPFKIPNGACVELYRADRYDDAKPGLWAFQGDNGKFEFDHIGPGEYVLVFNRMNRQDPNSPFPRTFYPGVADASETKFIHMKDGEQLLNANIKLRDGYPTRKLKVALKWKDGRPLGEVTVKAEAAQGGNPAAQKIADGVYQFTLLESARYTFSAWEDLDPQHAAPQRKGVATCPLPARIDSDSVTVDGADEAANEITLTFAPPPCKPENDQPTAPATPPTPAEAPAPPSP